MNLDKLLLQKEPFKFIDEVVELTEGKIKCSRTFREEEYYFQGHFPGNPIVPGVLLIEAMAQSGLLLLVGKEVIKNGYLAKIDTGKFHKIIKPGDKVLIETTLLMKIGDFSTIKSKITRGGVKVATATLVLKVEY